MQLKKQHDNTNALTPLKAVAAKIDIGVVDGRTVVNFDVDLDSDYNAGHEVQSRLVIEDGRAVGGVIRFGEAPLDAAEWLDTKIWGRAFTFLTKEILGDGVYRARLSDFGRPVPHLTVADVNAADAVEAIVTITETLSEWYDLTGETLGKKLDEYL